MRKAHTAVSIGYALGAYADVFCGPSYAQSAYGRRVSAYRRCRYGRTYLFCVRLRSHPIPFLQNLPSGTIHSTLVRPLSGIRFVSVFFGIRYGKDQKKITDQTIRR